MAQNLILIAPLALTNITSGNEKSIRPVTNIARNDQPGLIWESSGASNLWAMGQIPSGSQPNFFGLIGTNATTTTRARLTLGTAAGQVDGTANACLYPKDLDNAAWTKSGTASVSANATTAPDGTATADLCTVAVGGGNAIAYQRGSLTGSSPTPLGFWFKKVTSSGTLTFNNAYDGALGTWSLNLALLSADWEWITSSHAAVTQTYAFATTAGGIAYCRIYSTATTQFYLWDFGMFLGQSAAPQQTSSDLIIYPGTLSANGQWHSHNEFTLSGSFTHWRLEITGHSGDFQCAALVIGKKIAPKRYYDRDFEFGSIDLGNIDWSAGGVPITEDGVIHRTLAFRLSWVELVEYETTIRPWVEAVSKRSVIWCCFDPSQSAYRQPYTYFGWLQQMPSFKGQRKPGIKGVDFQIRSMI